MADATEAAVEKARYDAAASVRCAQNPGQSFGTCQAVSTRSGPSATVVVTFSNGFSRTLTFSDGDFLRGNATMSGVGTDTDWYREDATYHIRVDGQRFEIPAELVVD